MTSHRSKPQASSIHVVDPSNQDEYVLPSVAASDVVAPLFEKEDLTGTEAIALFEPVARKNGWLDALLDDYADYESHCPFACNRPRRLVDSACD